MSHPLSVIPDAGIITDPVSDPSNGFVPDVVPRDIVSGR
jgi:hypothetical protein